MLFADVKGKNKKDWNVTVKINSHNARIKIDTSVQCNVIKKLPPAEPTTTTQLQIQTRRIRMTRLNSIGRTTLLCEYKGQVLAS